MSGVRPLDGIRVLELSIAIAAPLCGRNLAYFGADVIRVESRQHPDVVRLLGSRWAREGEYAPVFLDTGPYLAEFDSGKRSVGIEVKKPGGLDAVRRLVAASDVFLTNYTTPAVRALGLGYEDVKAVKPDIIYVALPGFGSDETLPYYEYVAWGPNQAPLVGLDSLTGHADQDPCGISSISFPDYVSAFHASMAVMAGLEHRDLTGEGTHVDASQFEITVGLLGPFVMEHGVTGEMPARTGNRHANAAPCGVYPCRGRERWIAITVEDDDAWAALGQAAGSPEWAADERFSTAAGRLRHHDAIDEHLAAWTRQYGPEELAVRLQAAGVAAHALLDPPGILADAHIRERRWYDVRPSGRFHRDLFSGHPARLSSTPPSISTASPALAEHTVEVLRDVAGLEPDRIDELITAGAAFTMAEPELVVRRPYDAYLETFGLLDEEG